MQVMHDAYVFGHIRMQYVCADPRLDYCSDCIVLKYGNIYRTYDIKMSACAVGQRDRYLITVRCFIDTFIESN